MQLSLPSLTGLTRNTLALSSDKSQCEANGKLFIHLAIPSSYRTTEKQTALDHDNLNPYLEGDPDEIISEEDLPFTRFKLPPEEEEAGSIRTSTYVLKHFIL